jgi:flotillin
MESNVYLQQVVEEQAKVEGELRARRRQPAAGPAQQVLKFKKGLAGREAESSADFETEYRLAADSASGPAVDYRVTGFWRWKTVVVPPNVYVVHTRRGHAEPLHIGLGLSFRYNPGTDSFLVIPAAVQTLLISARCICAERQGVLVQAYVQWIVDDVRTAYRKLDFADPADPMRVVNVQLREQAEAAIKDKVATMPIDAVLSDKQPIIDELTHRLKAVAEGTRDGPGSGLGLKIVTVQIKEAVVSSTRLWENLQKPFRAGREKLARLAELDAQQEIATRELANRQAQETAELEVTRQRHRLQQLAEQQALAERAATEKARSSADDELAAQRHELAAHTVARELEQVRRDLDLEKARAELERARTGAAVEREDLVHHAQSARAEKDVALFKLRRAAENEMSEQFVRARLIERLPEIARELPRPDELRAISVGPDAGGTSLAGVLTALLSLAEGALKRPAASNGNGSA